MRALIQRVSNASVSISDNVKGRIAHGLLVLLGIEESDAEADVDWIVKKVISMRIFSDAQGKMQLSVNDVNGGILVISQFTLHASTRKGNRPSFIKAARPNAAIPLYESCISQFKDQVTMVESGTFGADMQVSLVNDGPVTIMIDSKLKE